MFLLEILQKYSSFNFIKNWLAIYLLLFNLVPKAGWCLPRGFEASSQVANTNGVKTPSGCLTGRRLIVLYMG